MIVIRSPRSLALVSSCRLQRMDMARPLRAVAMVAEVTMEVMEMDGLCSRRRPSSPPRWRGTPRRRTSYAIIAGRQRPRPSSQRQGWSRWTALSAGRRSPGFSPSVRSKPSTSARSGGNAKAKRKLITNINHNNHNHKLLTKTYPLTHKQTHSDPHTNTPRQAYARRPRAVLEAA